MIYARGKYNEAKIFTDLVEDAAIEQIKTMLDQEFVRDSRVRIMPDVHAGAGCTIGTTMTITDKVCPNLVGVDIGCGMLVVELKDKDIDLEELDRVIHKHVPSGYHINMMGHPYNEYVNLNELRCIEYVDIERAKLSLGTLGGGNHFIELNKDDKGHLYLVIHSGSRHLGLEVAGYYQHLAESQMRERTKTDTSELIADLIDQGRQSDIEAELKKFKEANPEVPKDLAYLTGQAFNDYIHDMCIVQNYAAWNRLAMLETIWANMPGRIHPKGYFTTIHNYIDVGNRILRKGAVSALDGERLIIPINMRDGSLICVGKGNPDWNYSAPHGAGRLMSRAQAKKSISMDEFEASMEGVYTTSVNEYTLDECPMAYKPMDSIVENISDTVYIEKIIRPIYNFKAGEYERR